MIQLKEITKENFWDCVSLETAEQQREFVTSNAVSIAQSKVQPECNPFAVYADDIMVGFVMYCVDTDDDEYWIYRMMIDKKHQGKGYGKEALAAMLDRIKADETRHCVYLGVHRESEAAVRMYERAGFAFTGDVYGDEHIMKLEY